MRNFSKSVVTLSLTLIYNTCIWKYYIVSIDIKYLLLMFPDARFKSCVRVVIRSLEHFYYLYSFVLIKAPISLHVSIFHCIIFHLLRIAYICLWYKANELKVVLNSHIHIFVLQGCACLFWSRSRPYTQTVYVVSNKDLYDLVNTRAPSQYKDRLIYVWRFPC